ncbi:hypothetical protein OAQ84_01135, partial [Bdellovibrionales bacterium]|nr:hypothetical protein [Bdellovibrionales bacterium]
MFMLNRLSLEKSEKRVDVIKSAAPTLLGNASGQGVLEYLLVLIVGVLIILGGVYQLNDAF